MGARVDLRDATVGFGVVVAAIAIADCKRVTCGPGTVETDGVCVVASGGHTSAGPTTSGASSDSASPPDWAKALGGSEFPLNTYKSKGMVSFAAPEATKTGVSWKLTFSTNSGDPGSTWIEVKRVVNSEELACVWPGGGTAFADLPSEGRKKTTTLRCGVDGSASEFLIRGGSGNLLVLRFDGANWSQAPN